MKTVKQFIVTLVCLMAFSCQKELSPENIVATLPTITTTAVTSITNTTAASGGNITDDGGAAITARGVCWSTSPNPVVSGNHTTDGTGSGAFASNITGLTATTVYYVRAYATNSEGTAYGNELSFTTTNTSTALPTVTTSSLSAITMTTASGGGNVVTDGGATVTARGICWATTANPDITASHTTDGTGTGIFTSAMAGLTAATIYHVRAYATNSVGTSYGGDSVFTTASAPTIPTIITTAISSITNTTANSGGTISTDGGAAVTVRGVCWSTTANPTTALLTKTSDGTGIGTFTSSITGLTAATTYHVRAYATNSVGTAYGNDVSFTTTGSSTPSVYVAGSEIIGPYVGKLWKDGVSTTFTNPASSGASGYGVFVSGTDVYIAGSEYYPPTNIAKLWKNGVPTTLTNTSCWSYAWSVFVAGTDVYVAGKSAACLPNSKATIWKNNVATDLTSAGVTIADARSVFVSGTDVYVVGTEERTPGINTAVLWKNGIPTDLTDGTKDAYALGVYVSGTDVYVVGGEDTAPATVAKIWKNGVATSLPNGSYAKSVFVSGTDVYAVGNEIIATTGYARMWKNGVVTSLSANASDASSVFVFGTDVYASGSIHIGVHDVATLWKNGVANSLASSTTGSFGSSVFVK